jgi:protein arginine kinase activator
LLSRSSRGYLMRKCEICSNTATVHLTKIVNKTKSEMHLCEACAKEQNLIPDSPQELNVPAILQLVMGQLPAPKPATADSICPECGTPYAHFRAQGRLGCPHDYDAFRPLLEPLIERVQSGGSRHSGKTPVRQRLRIARAKRLELESKLKAAVTEERYEEAARLRDSIRDLGADHEP